MSQKFHHAGWLFAEKKDSGNKNLKESQKREDELVTLTATAKENQDKEAERMGEKLRPRGPGDLSKRTWRSSWRG